MTAVQLKQFVRDRLTALRTIAQEYTVFDAFVDFITNSSSSAIPAWTSLLEFNLSGTGAGAYCTFSDSNGAIRFWLSKIDANIANPPPTSPVIQAMGPSALGRDRLGAHPRPNSRMEVAAPR